MLINIQLLLFTHYNIKSIPYPPKVFNLYFHKFGFYTAKTFKHDEHGNITETFTVNFENWGGKAETKEHTNTSSWQYDEQGNPVSINESSAASITWVYEYAFVYCPEATQ